MTVVINGTTGIDTGTGSLIAADSTTPTYLDLFEDTDNGSNYVRLIAPTSVASNRTITLPDGTGTVAVNGVSGVLVSGTAITLTNQTAPEFTGIPSWVKRITVMFSGVSTSGASLIQAQIGSGSFLTSGYTSNASIAGGGAAGAGYTSTSGFLCDAGASGASSTRSGTITLVNISGDNWVQSFMLGTQVGVSSYMLGGGGAVTLSGTLDRVRITTVNGTDTFDAGTINILYE